jgi:hypothetical protein
VLPLFLFPFLILFMFAFKWHHLPALGCQVKSIFYFTNG